MSELVTIRFSGEDTLCLTKFAKYLWDNREYLTPYIVHINGRFVKDDTKADIMGKLLPMDKYSVGYIRNIMVEDIHEPDNLTRIMGLSIGCSNATLEDIAANEVSFSFSESCSFQLYIDTTHYNYYRIPSTEKMNIEEMTSLSKDKPLNAIAIAKKLHNEPAALDLLITYLKNPPTHFDIDMHELTADAFRSFEDLCKDKPECSRNATDVLKEYINKNYRNHLYLNSVIYSIEALGFVANHHDDTMKTVCEFLYKFLDSYKNDLNQEICWHIVWASLFTLTNTNALSTGTS
jgi:hypothetical protein